MFSYQQTSYEDLLAIPLLVEPVHAVLPVGHELAGRAEITLDLLAGRPWIAGCQVCRAHLVAAAARSGFVPDVRHATDDYLVAQGLVAAGLGVTLLPARALAAVRHSRVLVVPVRDERFHVQVLLRAESARVPAVEALLRALTAVARPDTAGAARS